MLMPNQKALQFFLINRLQITSGQAKKTILRLGCVCIGGKA